MEKLPFTVIRGNISEIKTLALGSGKTRGVDADVSDAVSDGNLDAAVAFVKDFAQRSHAIVAVTGAIDLVSDADRCFVIRNGRPEMGKITGTGCQLSGMMTAFVAANPDRRLEAAAAAVCAMGLAGEIGWSRMAQGDGNSTYRNRIIDASTTWTAPRWIRGPSMRCAEQDLLLYAVTDRHWLSGRSLRDVVEESLRGGVTMLQLREKTLAELVPGRGPGASGPVPGLSRSLYCQRQRGHRPGHGRRRRPRGPERHGGPGRPAEAGAR